MDELIFEGKVDESEVGKLKPGMELLLTVGAIEDQKFEATLEHIAPKGVEENGAIQFEIRAALKLHDNVFVRANYSANADIVLGRRDDVLAVNEALSAVRGETSRTSRSRRPRRSSRSGTSRPGCPTGSTSRSSRALTRDDQIKNPNQQSTS